MKHKKISYFGASDISMYFIRLSSEANYKFTKNFNLEFFIVFVDNRVFLAFGISSIYFYTFY